MCVDSTSIVPCGTEVAAAPLNRWLALFPAATLIDCGVYGTIDGEPFGCFGSFQPMRLSEDALDHLRTVLVNLGFGDEVASASREDLEELGLFLLNLTAAAIKTRGRMRRAGRPLPPSSFPDENVPPTQAALPGFD